MTSSRGVPGNLSGEWLTYILGGGFLDRLEREHALHCRLFVTSSKAEYRLYCKQQAVRQYVFLC